MRHFIPIVLALILAKPADPASTSPKLLKEHRVPPSVTEERPRLSKDSSDFVSLADRFQSIQCPQVGGTCAIYTAVNLVEEYCKRVVGKSINLSEAQLFLQHARDVLVRPGMRPITDERLILGNEDGSHPAQSLKRIQEGKVLTEEEVGDSTKVLKDLHAIRRRFPPVLGTNGKQLCDSFECAMSQKGDIDRSTMDPGLRECLRHPFEIRTDSPSSKDRFQTPIELLRRQIPFGCEVVGHVLVVVGYRRSDKGGLEYQYRDSATGTTEWKPSRSCSRITYLTPSKP